MKLQDQYPSKIFIECQKETKKDEKDILEKFLSRMQLKYKTIQKSEKPDYVIKCQNGLEIPCEITRYYSDQFAEQHPKGKQLISDFCKFFQKLKIEISKEDYAKYIYGTIHFKKQPPKKILRDYNLIQEIKNLVNQNLKYLENPNDSIRIEQTNFEGSLIREYVNSIFLKNTYPDDILWWNGKLQSGEIANSKETIKKKVEDKNKKSRDYKLQNCERKWLLIYAEGLSLNDVCIIDQLKIIEKMHYFTNIFIFDEFTNTIKQIYPVL